MPSRIHLFSIVSISRRWLLPLALILALLCPPAAGLQAASPDGLPSCAETIRHPETGELLTLAGCQNALPAGADAETIARDFLSRHHEALAMPAGIDDLAVRSIRRGLNSSHVLFQQTHAGLPVYGAYVSVHLDRNRQIQLIHNRYLANLSVDLSNPILPAERAVALAREAIQFVAPRGENPPPQQVVLPLSRTEGRLAWQVMILASQPQGDWEVLVDASTGQVIKRYNRLIQARGQVYTPAAGNSSPADLFRPTLATVTLPGLDGSGWLRGDYVDLTWPKGYQPARAYDPSGAFIYEPGDPRFEEVMVYYHVDQTQRYLQALGYSDSNQPPNGIRDRVTYASAHWFDQDQSFYSISDDALHFGDGGVPDAQDPDLIVHEYAHALQHDQLICWGGGEMDAIGEGFGDYLAASRFAEESADPACIAEWDSQSYTSGPPYCLRRVDQERRYPEDLTGDSHLDGEIWSRVLWDLRSALGARKADTLAIESHFYMPCGATLIDAGQALLHADENLYAGQHRATIIATLVARGLMALPAPALLAPKGGQSFNPGDSLEIIWQERLGLPVSYQVQYSLNAGQVTALVAPFEGNTLPAGFHSFGNQPWRVANGAAQAGAIEHSQSSSLALTVNLAQANELRFRYRVSSEQGWDYFELLIDGQLILQASGEVAWTEQRSALAAGQHTIIWRYRKDSTRKAGQDSAWIDDVRIGSIDAAAWQEIATLPGNRLTWQAPETASSSVKVRVRALLDGAASDWRSSDGVILIGEPAAVRLSGFQTAEEARPAGRLPLTPWGLAALLAAAGLGLLLEALVGRRIGAR